MYTFGWKYGSGLQAIINVRLETQDEITYFLGETACTRIGLCGLVCTWLIANLLTIRLKRMDQISPWNGSWSIQLD